MAACALIVEFDLQPGAKPGCRQFDVLEPDDEENRVVLVEVYEDRAAYEAHRQGPRMPGVGAAMQPLITGRKRTVCTIM